MDHDCSFCWIGFGLCAQFQMASILIGYETNLKSVLFQPNFYGVLNGLRKIFRKNNADDFRFLHKKLSCLRHKKKLSAQQVETRTSAKESLSQVFLAK